MSSPSPRAHLVLRSTSPAAQIQKVSAQLAAASPSSGGLEASKPAPQVVNNPYSKEDLIISKLRWAKDSHSELQLGDVKNLLATGYDTVYLERWTRELGLNNLLQQCLYD
jgi:hypothetical protein